MLQAHGHISQTQRQIMILPTHHATNVAQMQAIQQPIAYVGQSSTNHAAQVNGNVSQCKSQDIIQGVGYATPVIHSGHPTTSFEGEGGITVVQGQSELHDQVTYVISNNDIVP